MHLRLRELLRRRGRRARNLLHHHHRVLLLLCPHCPLRHALRGALLPVLQRLLLLRRLLVELLLRLLWLLWLLVGQLLLRLSVLVLGRRPLLIHQLLLRLSLLVHLLLLLRLGVLVLGRRPLLIHLLLLLLRLSLCICASRVPLLRAGRRGRSTRGLGEVGARSPQERLLRLLLPLRRRGRRDGGKAGRVRGLRHPRHLLLCLLRCVRQLLLSLLWRVRHLLRRLLRRLPVRKRLLGVLRRGVPRLIRLLLVLEQLLLFGAARLDLCLEWGGGRSRGDGQQSARGGEGGGEARTA